MIKTQPSCADIFESGLLPVEQALEKIMSSIPCIDGFQIINIEKAKGRTLAQSIIAPFNVPQHNNSAVDGYAIRYQDLVANENTVLTIIDRAYAGIPSNEAINAGQCIRIMTGAAVPQGVNTVVMQEHVVLKGDSITLASDHRNGQNIRLAGEDIQQDAIILSQGRFITPADIGLMASLGITEIKVKRTLKVAIASTGNEVIGLGDIHSDASLYDSNRYSLYALLDRPDIEVINLGILEDNPHALLKSFEQASQVADLIISSGGVSVGDADYTKEALKQSGHVDFWKIAIKPGRPLAFGQIGGSVFFGLPGNPVAVMVTFFQFVLPALEQMMGIKEKPVQAILHATTTEDIRKKQGRTEVVRGILMQQDDGSWTVKTTGKQGSGILRSMSLANAFIILEHDRATVKQGECVTVQPFFGLF